jgi:hypothetical protein
MIIAKIEYRALLDESFYGPQMRGVSEYGQEATTTAGNFYIGRGG